MLVSLPEVYDKHPELRRNIVIAYRGSVAHGMYVPGTDPNSVDDIDLIGVVVPTIEHYYGLKSFYSDGTREIKDGDLDIVAYECRKFFRLLAVGNPNVMTLLWVDDKYVLSSTPMWVYIKQHRAMFSSKASYAAFKGYAKGQMHRMMNGEFLGHMGEKRKELFKKYGYDCKNAAHLIRLLRMGVEFLQTGVITVDRYGIDAEELLSIKRGEWSLADVNATANSLFERMEIAMCESTLPDEVDKDAISKLCVDIVEMTISRFEHV